MRVGALFLALSSLTALATSAPYIPWNGKLQRIRRRAVDYPLLPYGAPVVPEMQAGPKLLKRSVPYSVVPVDGGSSGSNNMETTTIIDQVLKTVEPSPTTQTVFVTEPASTANPVTKTVVRTKVLTHTHKSPGKTVHEKVYLTTTEIETTTDVETSSLFSPAPIVTVDPEPKIVVSTLEPVTKTKTKQHTVMKTAAAVTETVTTGPASTSTQYYDNGMWHTLYPETKDIAPATGTITTAPVPTSTQYYDTGMWNPPYPKSLTTSVTTSLTTPQNSSAPALTKRNVESEAGVAFAYRKNSYGYGSSGKRAKESSGTSTSPPVSDSAFSNAYSGELVKRSTDEPTEQVAGTKLTRRQLRRLRKSMR